MLYLCYDECDDFVIGFILGNSLDRVNWRLLVMSVFYVGKVFALNVMLIVPSYRSSFYYFNFYYNPIINCHFIL